ncbi:MAG TPA: P-loop NTPase fold protein [Burkholderiales bacterium]|nr:P-loop NTPase fold protein [Burkholderiales bacterium]
MPTAPASEGAVDRRSDHPHAYRPERVALARRVAALIGSYRGREALVVGIEGAWGAGKVEFTGLVLKALDEIGFAVVLPFNPWSVSEQRELMSEFVAALAAALTPGESAVAPHQAQSYGARLRETAARSLRLSAQQPDTVRVAYDRERNSPHEARGPIHDKLANLPGRLVVVMDDVDRIDEQQTRIVMKLVRIAASLPNLVFLLSYDRKRVAACLQEDDRPGDDTLKALVHIAFTLPEPSRQELDHVLFARLRETVSRIHGDSRVPDDDERWRDLVYAALPPLFCTIADIGGYTASLRYAFGLAGEDAIDTIDFIGIEAIRYFAPRVYAVMAANRTLFTSSASGDEASERRARYEDLLRAAPEDVRAAIDGVCRCLFPALTGVAVETGAARVASAASFPGYFRLGVPEPLVSESEVLFLRRRFGSAAAVTGLLREYLDDGRLAPLLLQLVNRSAIVSESDAKALLLGLWALEDDIERGDAGDVHVFALQLARNLVRDSVKAERREAFLAELAEATGARRFPEALVRALEQQPLQGAS